MNEYELIYGKGIKTERDVVILCLENLAVIETVIDIKGLEPIHTYINSKFVELNEKKEK